MIEKIKNLFRHKHVWIPDVVYINTETNFGMFNYHCKGCDHAFRARQHRLIRDGKIIEMPYHTWDIPEQDTMKTIWKYSVNIRQVKDRVMFSMPEDSMYLSADRQGDDLCVWALVDSDKPYTSRGICIRGTGLPITGSESGFIDTVLFNDYGLVFHVFDDGVVL